MGTLIRCSRADVSEELARRSHQGTSMSPEKRGKDAVTGYTNHVGEVAAEFEKWATDENREAMTAGLEEWRAGYAKRLQDCWSAHSRCISTMITGPSGFPVRRAQKANTSADNRLSELLEWSARRLKRLRGSYDPRRIAKRPIKAGDSDAVERLEAKIKAATELQEIMKAANRVLRRKSLDDAGKVSALVEMGLSETNANKLMLPDFAGRVGFPPYELSNNNANIRRMKGRLETIKAAQAAPDVEDREEKGVIICENREEDRLQLIFPGKPSESVRSLLKSRGFRWSRRFGAWQRQLTNNARYAVKVIIDQIETQ